MTATRIYVIQFLNKIKATALKYWGGREGEGEKLSGRRSANLGMYLNMPSNFCARGINVYYVEPNHNVVE